MSKFLLAFKPACGFDYTVDYSGITFSPKATWFRPVKLSDAPSALGICVAYAHFAESRRQEYLNGTYIMLDCALGELALAEQVHYVEVEALPSSPETSGYQPLVELTRYLEPSI